MPESNSLQQTKIDTTHFRPLSRAAVVAFSNVLPKLQVFVNDKFLLENKFECEDARCEKTGLVHYFNRKFGELLLGIYEFSLYGILVEEVAWLFAEFESRGLKRIFIEADLKSWILGINSMIKHPESAELVQPIECMYRYMTAVFEQLGTGERPLNEQTRQFVDFLLQKNRKFAAEYILSLIREGSTIEQVYMQVLLPSLTHIRLLWRSNKISAADENVATDICRYIILRIVDNIFGERKYPFKVLVACVPEEEDVLGSEVFANFLEIKGWSVYYIGHGFSSEDIITAIVTNKPQVVVLSAMYIAYLPSAKRLVEQIKQIAPQVKIVMEGRAFRFVKEQFQPMVDAIVSSFEEGQKIMLDMVMPRA